MSTARRRWVVTALAATVLGAAGLAANGLRQGLVYYRTPSEVVAGDVGRHLRVGGMVVAGSVTGDGAVTSMMLTDGAAEIRVAVRGALPEIFGEGRGAVAEGVLHPDKVLQADRLLMRHSNEYRPPGGEAG